VRHRLLLSTVGAVTVAIVLLGVPLSYFARYAVERQAYGELTEAIDGYWDAASAAGAEFESSPDTAREALVRLLREFSADQRRYMIYVGGGGGVRRLWDSGRGGPLPNFDDDVVHAATALRTGSVHRHGVLAVTVPYEVDGGWLLIRAIDDDARVTADLARLRFSIGSLALLSLLAATLLALWQGKRFAVPIQHLAASARRLGDGDFTARAPRSGLPEPDEVAAALDSTASRLGAMLERSRSFTADASHQLRTPLTALRLDLEALELTDADPELVRAAIAEADRLEATITELLALAEAPRGYERVDLADLAGARLDAWTSLAKAKGREVRLSTAPVPPVRARSAALGQSLQVLLDNALEHGQGTITVSVAEVLGGVRVCVADEGPGIPPEREHTLFDGAASPDGHGRGLPLARSLVEAEGGRLALERARPGASVCLLFPTDRESLWPLA
jgi:signal transduction histidine kinase